MNVILTGATGFVGKNLVRRLLGSCSNITAFVRNYSSSLPAEVKQIIVDLSDLKQSDTVSNAIQDVDVVIHVAARAHVMADHSKDPLAEYRKINRDATIALAKISAKAGVKRFVFLSSVKVNGEVTDGNSLFSPSDVCTPVDPYAVSKYEAEQALLEIAENTEMEVVIIRPPLVYGEEVKGNFSSLINWVRKSIPLPLGAVHNLRSFIALDNLVDFILLCADTARSPNAANQVFLISDDEDISTAMLLQRIAKAYKVKLFLIPVPVGLMRFSFKLLGKSQISDRLFASLQVDISKSRNLLGWSPVVTMNDQLSKMAKEEL